MIKYYRASSLSIAQLIMPIRYVVTPCSQKLQLTQVLPLRAVSAIASHPPSPHLCLNVALELHLWIEHKVYLALKYALFTTTCKSLQIRPYVFTIKLPPENVGVSWN